MIITDYSNHKTTEANHALQTTTVADLRRSAKHTNSKVKKQRKKQASEAPEKKTPWSTQFFIGAAIAAGWITLQIFTGESLSKYNSREINRSEHVFWYIFPFLFCLIGFAFHIHERGKK